MTLPANPPTAIDRAATILGAAGARMQEILQGMPVVDRITFLQRELANFSPQERSTFLNSLSDRQACPFDPREKFTILLQILDEMDPALIPRFMTDCGIDSRLAAPERDAALLALLSDPAKRRSIVTAAESITEERGRILAKVLRALYADPALTAEVNRDPVPRVAAIQAACTGHRWIRRRTFAALIVSALLTGGIFASVLNGKIPKGKGIAASLLPASILVSPLFAGLHRTDDGIARTGTMIAKAASSCAERVCSGVASSVSTVFNKVLAPVSTGLANSIRRNPRKYVKGAVIVGSLFAALRYRSDITKLFSQSTNFIGSLFTRGNANPIVHALNAILNSTKPPEPAPSLLQQTARGIANTAYAVGATLRWVVKMPPCKIDPPLA